MSKLFLGGFVLVAAVAVGAVDYINQARRAGAAPGAFSMSAYVGTISGRLVDQQASLAAQKTRNELLAMAPRDFLPVAPEGWSRGDWTETAEAQFGKHYDLQNDDFAPDEVKQDTALKALNAMSRAAVAKMDATQVYVYEKPDAVVAMRVAVRPAGTGAGLPAMAMQMAANNIEAMSGKDGFAIVKGVTYRLEKGLFGMQDQERDFRVISGKVGDDVRISVRAKASDEDIIALLEGIDYDRLNQMLETPVAGIGSDAPELTAEESRALADANVAEAAAAQRAETLEQQRRVQLAALDINFRHGQITEEKYNAAKARLMAQETPVEAIAALATAASAEASPAAAPSGGTGVLAMLGGLFGAKGGDPAPVEATAKPEVRVNGLGGNCTVTNGVKRCSLGGN